jgi:hypothetical protein
MKFFFSPNSSENRSNFSFVEVEIVADTCELLMVHLLANLEKHVFPWKN